MTGARIAAALVAAQAELRAIGKDARNPHFNSKFASLDAIIEEVRPVLAKHALAISQGAEPFQDGKGLIVHTVLIHDSGEMYGNQVYIPIVKQDPQGAGGALTYGRRYGLSALLSLATEEDDDGNAASKPARKAAPRGAAPESETSSGPMRSGFTGPSYDYPIPFGDDKGKRLGDIPTPGLKRLQKWVRDPEHTDRKAKFAELDKALTDVLAARALGTDVDSEVARMQAAEDKAADNLPF